MDFDLAAVLTSLGVGGILAKLLDWFIKIRKEKKEANKSFTYLFKSIQEVYYTLMTILRNSKACRVLILKTTNGGGRPRLGGSLYGSVIYEVFEYPLRSIKDKWINQRLDPPYLEMLYELDKNGFVDLITENMQPGILKTVYEASGVVQTYVYELHQREDQYIYISLNFTELVGEMDAKNKDMLRSGINSLVHIFKTNTNV